MSAYDTQVGGDHYKSMPIQPMQYSMANKLDACQHTVIKYVTRFREKGGVQDLRKAKHVIDMLIESEMSGGKVDVAATATATKGGPVQSSSAQALAAKLQSMFPGAEVSFGVLDEESGLID